MKNLKFKSSMALVFFAAFIWGYKKDSLQAYFQDHSATTPPVEQPTAPPSSNTPKLTPAPVVSTSPTTNVAPATTAPPKPPRPTPSARSEVPTYTPPKNPYSNLSKQLNNSADPDSFREAFGSIQRDSISKEELMRKNSYFRKLSNDLQELQGEGPPTDAELDAGAPGENTPTFPAEFPGDIPGEANVPGQSPAPYAEGYGAQPYDENIDPALADSTLPPIEAEREAIIDELDSLIDESLAE